jgi:cyclic pyranopterin phosphate synthase
MIRLAPGVVPVARPPSPLFDNHGREITYLRLGITDRCNLRCRYCRPEQGVPFIPHREILTFEELERLVALCRDLGVSKVRVTGGEPFSRRGCLPFLGRLRQIQGVDGLHITTNGVKTARYLDALVDLGINSINLSLDTLDRQRFWQITRRDYLVAVLQTLHGVLARNIPLKINSVVLPDTGDEEIIRLAGLSRDFPITLRFIEPMPFSGRLRSGGLGHGNLAKRLGRLFPAMQEHGAMQPTTARLFAIPDYRGKIGIIEGYSRHFCRTCNKLRITPTGMLKTCLYDNGALDLKMLLRRQAEDREIKEAIISRVANRFVNGYEAERVANRAGEPSMAGIGG